MSLPALLQGRLRLPVIGAPMFIASGPQLVVAQCTAGIVGSFPALNARTPGQLEEWLVHIEGELSQARAAGAHACVAPFAVNLILHGSNARAASDLDTVVRHRVPIVITSVGKPASVVPAVHGYGGLVFHDVTNLRFAEKALEAGVDGLILVCAGAGGHAGSLSPFAFVEEVRRIFSGTVVLAGALATGRGVRAAQVMGADLAYLGTRFLATPEANVAQRQREMIVRGAAADVVYTPYFSGIPANYLRESVAACGFDPDALPAASAEADLLARREGPQPWRDVWSAGQGIGSIAAVQPAADVVRQLEREYAAAAAVGQ
jgi:nitronate monooxygenase